MCSTLKNALQHPTVLMSSEIITGIGCFHEERSDWMTSCAMEVQAGLSISAQDPSAVPIRRFSVLLLPKILSAQSAPTELRKCLKWCVDCNHLFYGVRRQRRRYTCTPTSQYSSECTTSQGAGVSWFLCTTRRSPTVGFVTEESLPQRTEQHTCATSTRGREAITSFMPYFDMAKH
jgi:hypothetical protein